ncbi:MAG: serine hydrolase [Sphingomicrobium sp.]
MTSQWLRFSLASGSAALLAAGASVLAKTPDGAPAKPVDAKPVPAPIAAAPAPVLAPAPKPIPVAPAYLRGQLAELGRKFDGRVGIAVRSVDDGWTATWKADELYPQQSVSKLWVAVTALDAADKGRVKMSDTVTMSRADLTVFHQPIAARILGGRYMTTLDDLLFKAITTSDNTANDKLMRSVGGPKAVRAVIAAKKLGAIRFYDGEKALQSRIAGLLWSPKYSIGSAFWQARNALPFSIRKAAFDRYVADPYDGASPTSIVTTLARLKRGELLSPESTRRLLHVMGNTKTGANRLKGGLRPGWSLSHKTGTGQELGRFQAGYNDIGIVVAPGGKSYAVAVMIKLTDTPLPTRMILMNNVVRAIIVQHDMINAPLALQTPRPRP